ncbi:MAG: hypothetical protein Q4C05_06345 [Akkermansia sp.]|nr:hypothetical protein [Akkermansia sp.]
MMQIACTRENVHYAMVKATKKALGADIERHAVPDVTAQVSTPKQVLNPTMKRINLYLTTS